MKYTTALLCGLLLGAAALAAHAGDHADGSGTDTSSDSPGDSAAPDVSPDSTPDPTAISTTSILTDDRVRLRDSAGLDGQTLGYLSKGDTVTVMARSDDLAAVGDQDAWSYWYHVTTSDSQDGYVFGSFLGPVAGKPPAPQWFSMSTSGKRHYGSRYVDVAADSAGNVYVVGTFDGEQFRFGKNAIIKGANDGENPLLLKLDRFGNALWARTIRGAKGGSSFNAVRVDKAGTIYVAGGLQGDQPYDFGDGVSVKGTSATSNAVVARYDKQGRVQWARSATSGKTDSVFYAMAVDQAGGVYAAGETTGSGVVKFGDYVSTHGSANSDKTNVLLVKFDASGNTSWARSQSAGRAGASYAAVAVDAAGNVYAAGSTYGPEKYGFEGNVSVAGTAPKDGTNALLVSYDPQGKPRWARTQTAGTHGGFEGVTIDQAGNLVAAGYFGGAGISFSKDVTVSEGARNLGGVVAWYAPDGTPLRAAGLSDEKGDDVYFNGVAPMRDGGVCAAGVGPAGGILREYDSTAESVWDLALQNVTPQGSLADKGEITAVAADPHGTLYTAGSTTATDVADYGVLVKY